jgi:hypothetical protein
MKRRYNHETKQWDIVLTEEQYGLLKMRGHSFPKLKIIQIIDKKLDNYRLPDGADLAHPDMMFMQNLPTNLATFLGTGGN